MTLPGADALLLLQLSDVRALAPQAAQLGETRLVCVDPHILDSALQAGLQQAELRRIDPGRDLQARAYAEGMMLAHRIDLELSALRRELWGRISGAPASAWHGWDLSQGYMWLQRALTQRAIGRTIEAAFPERQLGVLRPGNPALFHLDSALSADVVAADPARWSVVGRYEHGLHWNPLLLDAVIDFDGVAALARAGHAGCVTHLPTSLYDAKAFIAGVERSFARNIDLPSPYADLPVRRAEPTLMRRLGDLQFDPSCRAYRDGALRVVSEVLAPWVPSRAAVQHQAQAIARRAELQAVNYLGLKRALAGTRPHFVLTSHDSWLNGPLFTIAAELGSEITVLPHSAYTATLPPHAERVTVVERDGVGVPVRSTLGVPVAVRGVRFRPPAEPQPRPAPRRLCLLFNAMHGDGVGYQDVWAIGTLYRRVAALCAQHGWDLTVRLKPGSAALSVLAGILGVPAGQLQRTLAMPVQEVARETDLCVAYGEPTSATIAFLDAASYVVHTSDQEWPADYVVTCPLMGALMPSWRTAALCDALAPLLADPAAYAERQQAQAAAYAARRAGAHDHLFPFTRPDLTEA